MTNKNFKVLISSCDKYSYLWKLLEFSHKNYFPTSLKDNTILISETLKSSYFTIKGTGDK